MALEQKVQDTSVKYCKYLYTNFKENISQESVDCPHSTHSHKNVMMNWTFHIHSAFDIFYIHWMYTLASNTGKKSLVGYL